jgi:hypothetical protein
VPWEGFKASIEISIAIPVNILIEPVTKACNAIPGASG